MTERQARVVAAIIIGYVVLQVAAIVVAIAWKALT